MHHLKSVLFQSDFVQDFEQTQWWVRKCRECPSWVLTYTGPTSNFSLAALRPVPPTPENTQPWPWRFWRALRLRRSGPLYWVIFPVATSPSEHGRLSCCPLPSALVWMLPVTTEEGQRAEWGSRWVNTSDRNDRSRCFSRLGGGGGYYRWWEIRG